VKLAIYLITFFWHSLKILKNSTNYINMDINVISSTLCLIGYFGIGKSSLVNSFVNNSFNKNSESTIGMSYVNKTINGENFSINLNIWDTAGQERYAALLPMYTRDTDVILCLIDPTMREKSVEYLKKNLKFILEKRTNNPPYSVHVVISKIDTQKNEDYKQFGENVKTLVENYLFRLNIEYTDVSLFYTSSKNFLNVEQPFLHSLERIYREKNKNILLKKQQSQIIKLQNNKEQQKSKCYCYN